MAKILKYYLLISNKDKSASYLFGLALVVFIEEHSVPAK